MSGADTRQQKIKRFLMSLPGKKGIDIPEDLHDRIFHVARGITEPLWGRPPTPEQMQYLHDNGHHTPDKIHEVFSQLDHPHANGLKVGEYNDWKKAHEDFGKHRLTQ